MIVYNKNDHLSNQNYWSKRFCINLSLSRDLHTRKRTSHQITRIIFLKELIPQNDWYSSRNQTGTNSNEPTTLMTVYRKTKFSITKKNCALTLIAQPSHHTLPLKHFQINYNLQKYYVIPHIKYIEIHFSTQQQWARGPTRTHVQWE